MVWTQALLQRASVGMSFLAAAGGKKSPLCRTSFFFFFDYSKASLIIQNSWGDSCDFIPCRSRWAITSSHRAVLALLPVVAGFSLMLWKLCPPQPNMRAYRWTNWGSFVLMLSAKPWQQRTKGPRTACAKGKTFLCFVVILPCWLWEPWRSLVAAS